MRLTKLHWVVLYCPYERHISPVIFNPPMRRKADYYAQRYSRLPIEGKRTVTNAAACHSYLARLNFQIQLVKHGDSRSRWIPESDIPQLNCTGQGTCGTSQGRHAGPHATEWARQRGKCRAEQLEFTALLVRSRAVGSVLDDFGKGLLKYNTRSCHHI